MKFTVKIRDLALDDLREMPRNIQARVIRSIESRLAVEPTRYGVRLRRSLAGLWKIRVGDYRIVYELEGQVVTVWAIRHRKNVYPEVERRKGIK